MKGEKSNKYKRQPHTNELSNMGTYSEKKIADRVFLVKYVSHQYERLVHHCSGHDFYKEMTFRESDEGPMYWCEGCGFVLGNGEAMALRLYEAPF